MAGSRTPPPLRARPLVGALVRAYEEQLTARGRFLLWSLAAFALVGLDTRRSGVFVLFAMAAGAFFTAWMATRFRRAGVALTGSLPARATAGVPLAVTFRLRNESPRLRRDVHLSFPRPLRWGDSIKVNPSESILDVPGEGTSVLNVELLATRRGRYELRGPQVRATDPLGLAASPGRALPGHPLFVYPRFYRMETFPVPQGRRYQPGGIPLSSSLGDAIEFVGTREYRPGDAVKSIHWPSFARRGAPVVKEFQEEYFCRIALILDTFLPRRPRPRDTAAFEAAISVLASIADHFSRSEYVVDVLAAGPDLYEVSAGRSLGYLENILDVLACLEPCREPPFQTIGPVLFEKLAQTTTVVAVLLDWDDEREAFLRSVKASGTALRAVVVRDGATGRPWAAASDDLCPFEQLTPADVERAIAAGGAP